MKFHHSTFIIALIGLSMMAVHTYADDLEHRLYVGLWSEHWYADRPDFNEDNQVVQYTVFNHTRKGGGEFLTAGTFLNSFGGRTYAIGYGQEYAIYFMPEVAFGWQVGVLEGYGDKLRVNWGSISPAIQFHFKYEVFKVQIMGPAINVGIEHTF